jgi:excisionase family DNA binding protein
MLYNVKEASRLLSVSLKTIERALADGRLQCRRIGRAIRFTREDLERFIGTSIRADTEKPVTPEVRHVIPPEIIKTLERELTGISHGIATLTIHIRDNHPRFVIGRERSFIQDAKEPGGTGGA